MAYDEYQADRIRQVLKETNTQFIEKKMIGGLCFMVDDKMLCGTHTDKKSDMNLLMARIGTDAYPDAIEKEGVLPMDFTGRPLKGFIFISPDGYDRDEQLAYWIKKCLDFNPEAKASKKKKKKLD